MISFIRGTVADLTESSAIIESNCIGFEINMTGNALALRVEYDQPQHC